MKTKLLAGLFFLILFTACKDDDIPEPENDEEIIDYVSLTFTPKSGGVPIIATAIDPDGEGVKDFEFTDIKLNEATEYQLSIDLRNTATNEDIGDEIREEADEHMFFFGFGQDIFTSPTGNGNIDSRQDDVNYDDEDSGGLPLGLKTSWTTGGVDTEKFRVVLKHQPGVKTATSDVSVGSTDLDLEWNIIIQ